MLASALQSNASACWVPWSHGGPRLTLGHLTTLQRFQARLSQLILSKVPSVQYNERIKFFFIFFNYLFVF